MKGNDKLNKENNTEIDQETINEMKDEMICPLCFKQCPITQPGCGKGRAYAQTKGIEIETVTEDGQGELENFGGHGGCGNHAGHAMHGTHGHHDIHGKSGKHAGYKSHEYCPHHGDAEGNSGERLFREGNPVNNLMHLFQKCTHLVQHRKVNMQGRGHIMVTLLKQGVMTQRDLMHNTDVRSSSISELLGKMEADGWVTREKDEADKRNLRILLTEKGMVEAQTQLESQKQSTQELFNVLDEQEKQQLETILGKLLDSWKEDGMFDGRGRGCRGIHKGHHGKGHGV